MNSASVSACEIARAGAGAVTLRRFPFPYRSMLSVCSDIDRMTMPRFRLLHRFLNTREETPLGPGVGLDVADSMWVFKQRRNAVDIALMKDLGSREPSDYAEELAHYVHCGWIDTLHSYGNYSIRLPGRPVFERSHAELAIALLREREIKLTTWVNHGNVGNTQNFGHRISEVGLGDLPGSPAYHTDLLLDYGIRFAWNHTEPEAFGHRQPIAPLPLRDGRRLWGFPRFTATSGEDARAIASAHRWFYERHPTLLKRRSDGSEVVLLWWPALLDAQLTERRLDALVAEGQFAIVGQHLGNLEAGEDRLSAQAIAAFRRLRRYQEEGRILVTRTSRQLEYARVTANLQYTATYNGRFEIDITAVHDPVLGTHVPAIRHLRGVTLYVPDAERTLLFLNGRAIPRRHVCVHPSDGTSPSIGIRWHEEDVRDHAAAYRQAPAAV